MLKKNQVFEKCGCVKWNEPFWMPDGNLKLFETPTVFSCWFSHDWGMMWPQHRDAAIVSLLRCYYWGTGELSEQKLTTLGNRRPLLWHCWSDVLIAGLSDKSLLPRESHPLPHVSGNRVPWWEKWEVSTKLEKPHRKHLIISIRWFDFYFLQRAWSVPPHTY